MFNNFHPDLKTLYEMAPLDSCLTYGSSGSTSSNIAARTSPDQIGPPFLDPILPELNQSTQTLPDFPPFNPADIPSLFDEFISELNSQPAASAPPLPINQTDDTLPPAWYDFQPPPPPPLPVFPTPPLPVLQLPNQEESGIKLVHEMMKCAGSVQSGNLVLAGPQVEKLHALLTLVDCSSGIGKVAGYFIGALSRRIYSTHGFGPFPVMTSATDNDSFYHGFYEATPFFKFAHFTANQAILEAVSGRDCVHIIDFSITQGLQWPVLMQALAMRLGGPPALKITGVGFGKDSLNAVGLKLAETAREMKVKFEFRAVAVSRLDEMTPEMLDVQPGEAIAVNSVFELHKLIGLDEDPVNASSVKTVLSWVQALNPTIVTVVEQEADLNHLGFLDRFSDALMYYATIFDSLEVCSAPREKALAEMYLQREIVDVVCFEGSARRERFEPLTKWKLRLSEAGFQPMCLGLNAFTQASMLLQLFSAGGYCVDEFDGCVRLGWHGLPLIVASAWQPIQYFD